MGSERYLGSLCMLQAEEELCGCSCALRAGIPNLGGQSRMLAKCAQDLLELRLVPILMSRDPSGSRSSCDATCTRSDVAARGSPSAARRADSPHPARRGVGVGEALLQPLNVLSVHTRGRARWHDHSPPPALVLKTCMLCLLLRRLLGGCPPSHPWSALQEWQTVGRPVDFEGDPEEAAQRPPGRRRGLRGGRGQEVGVTVSEPSQSTSAAQ